jgi:hypothetical protein
MESVLVCEIDFQSTGYDEEDIKDIKATFSQFGAVRTRPIGIPSAEGIAELWLIIAFIGSHFASGFLKHAGADLYSKLEQAIKGFLNRKASRDWPAEPQSLTISYDDIDIVISNPSPKMLASFSSEIEKVAKVLNKGILSGFAVRRIHMPVLKEDETWTTFISYDESLDGPHRYWGIALESDWQQLSHVYDSEQEILYEHVKIEE